MTESPMLPKIVALIAIGFGLLTVASGGTALLGGLDMGAVMPFVLWFNTGAGIAYLLAGFGLWQGKSWAFWLALAIFAATLAVFVIFGIQVARGVPFEMRTVFAMTLRSAIWGGIALVARRTLTPDAGSPFPTLLSVNERTHDV